LRRKFSIHLFIYILKWIVFSREKRSVSSKILQYYFSHKKIGSKIMSVLRSLLCLLSSLPLIADSYVVGLGACTVDLLVQVDDSFVEQYVLSRRGGGERGTPQMLDDLLLQAHILPKIVPGGSSANTIRALSKLGASCAFLSHVGNDSWGDLFSRNLRDLGVDLRLKQAPFTSRVLCLISPDGQRTFLGVDPQLEDLSPSKEDLQNAKWLHVEARSLSNQVYVENTLKMAKELGIKISIDLSSFNIVEQYRDLLAVLIRDYAEIVFCNEDEIMSFTGLDAEQGSLQLQKVCPIVVVTLGSQGSLVGSQGKCTLIPPSPAEVVDTTGAGDYFAAGFLYGYLNEKSLQECGQLGNRLGSAIISVIGAELSPKKWEELLSCLKLEGTL
jgi:sugar/nucleoside kinase (ribokinase family)